MKLDVQKCAGEFPPYSTYVKSAGTFIGGGTPSGGSPLRNYVRGGWSGQEAVPSGLARQENSSYALGNVRHKDWAIQGPLEQNCPKLKFSVS